MALHTVGILGGSGFVGSHLVSCLSQAGHKVRVLSRRPERHRELAILPTAEVVFADLKQPETVRAALEGCDVGINLVGILNERGHNGKHFREVHVQYTKLMVEMCKAVKVKRYLHMSALGANQAKAPSHYLRTKGEAEDWAHQQGTNDFRVTSFRPSIIFGPGDSFFNRFATLLRLAPGFFPLPCANSLYAPIYVGDLVQLMTTCVDAKDTVGARYDLCGPTVYTLGDLVEYLAKLLGLEVTILRLNNFLSKLQATVMEYVPGKPFSLDNYWSTTVPSVCEKPLADLFDLQPKNIEVIVPTYLGPQTKLARLSRLREVGRR